MEELRRPIGPEHTEVITSDGTHQVEIAPAGACINFMQPHGGWVECDPTAVETLTGSSGRSRSVFTRMPLTVGVRTDAAEAEIVTLRLSNDPSKTSEIAFTLVSIEDDGAPQTVDLNEHVVDGQIVNKGGQVVDVVSSNTLRLLTPYRAGIKSRKVIYSVTVPDGYAIVQGETWPQIHDRNGYLRSLRAVLLDKDMQPVLDGRAEMPRPIDAIALSVAADGVDESGRPRYTLTKSSKIDLASVSWTWFDVEVSLSRDNNLYVASYSSNWTSCRSGSNNLAVAKTGNTAANFLSDPTFALWRLHLPFSLPAGNVAPTNAILKGVASQDSSGATACVIKSTVPIGTALSTSHWASIDQSTVYGRQDIPATKAGASWKVQLGQNMAAFTASNIMLAVLSSQDFDNITPTKTEAVLSPASSIRLILVYPHSGPSKQLYFNEALKPSSGRVQFPIRINRADTNGAAVLDGLLDKTTAKDLHFRKADGSLIPAFARTVTRDTNNAITQIDCRFSVDAADLSGVKLCYGDPAYSDLAVDYSQITGSTVAQAEANPQPGTFWDYAAIITLVVPPAAWSPLVESNPAEPFRATHSFPQVFQVEAKIFAAILIRGDFVIYKNRNNTLVWTISRKPGESAGPDLTKITKMTLSLHDMVIQSDNTAGSALRWVSETPASGPVLRVTLDLGGVTNLPLGDIPAELVLFDANNAKGWVSVQKTITIKPSVGA